MYYYERLKKDRIKKHYNEIQDMLKKKSINISRDKLEEIIDAHWQVNLDTLFNEKELRIDGFCNFNIIKRAKRRTMMNYHTKKEYIASEYRIKVKINPVIKNIIKKIK